MNTRIDLILRDAKTLNDMRNPDIRKKLLERIKENCEALLNERLPEEPPPALLWSMAMRLNHAFGITKNDSESLSSGVTESERQSTLADMRKVYEEVSGRGFFKWG